MPKCIHCGQRFETGKREGESDFDYMARMIQGVERCPGREQPEGWRRLTHEAK